MEGLIFNIQRFSIHDGPGIRLTVFLKGCPLNCWWCHNPESQSKEIEELEKVRKIGDKEIIEKEIVGINEEELIAEIEKEKVFFEESGGGVSFSGGEPLAQHDFLLKMLRTCRGKSIHTCVDTTGYASEKVFQMIAEYVDLFLFDLKIINEKNHINFCGVSVNPILKNLTYLNNIKKNVIIRFPVIPGFTDKPDNIKEIINFLKPLENIRKVELLPYHRIADGKYKKFNIHNKMIDVQPPSINELNKIKDKFEKNGFIISP
ncbi:glycyl-radical enzyme activating protein [Bacteroidota bacterium]